MVSLRRQKDRSRLSVGFTYIEGGISRSCQNVLAFQIVPKMACGGRTYWHLMPGKVFSSILATIYCGSEIIGLVLGCPVDAAGVVDGLKPVLLFGDLFGGSHAVDVHHDGLGVNWGCR